MADRITTNQDLIDLDILTGAQILNLSDSNDRYDDWEDRHIQAWAEIKAILFRTNAIEESSLSDTTELKSATCHYVAYLALRRSKFTDLKESANTHLRLALLVIDKAQLTINGSIKPSRPLFGAIRVIRG
jgi:hypothetical protein